MTITVYGVPAPQGSKRFVGHAKSGRGIMIESSVAVKPWREAVKWAAMGACAVTGPVRVTMTFTLPKPKSAPKTCRTYPDRKPDLSKLIRSTEDALTDAGVLVQELASRAGVIPQGPDWAAQKEILPATTNFGTNLSVMVSTHP